MPARWLMAALLPAGFVLILMCVRIEMSDRFTWLPLNVVLAVLPVLFAAAVRPGRLWPAAAWLLFFPNAPYVVSDVVHFASRPPVPAWFDAAMLGLLAAAGVFAGAVSMAWVIRCIREQLGRPAAWASWLVIAAATGRAIELGRVQRYHSWHLVLRPGDVLGDVFADLASPDPEVWAMTAVYGTAALVFGLSVDLLAAPVAQNTSATSRSRVAVPPMARANPAYTDTLCTTMATNQPENPDNNRS